MHFLLYVDTNILKYSIKNNKLNIFMYINGFFEMYDNIYEIEASDINLSSFKAKDELHPKIWVNNKINSRIRLKLLDIADDFIDSLEIDWVKPKDIILAGSIANYNWSRYSDIDVHIIMDYNEVYRNKLFVKDYFNAKKDLWKNNHNELTIYGFPVEMYVEDVDEPSDSSGKYSLIKNKWLNEPKNLENAKINATYVKKEAAKYINQIDGLHSKLRNEDIDAKIIDIGKRAQNLLKKLKGIRKESLQRSGEMGSGNIIYKILRRMSYLDRLRNIINWSYDKGNSINEFKINEDSDDFVLQHTAIPHKELPNYKPKHEIITAYKQFKLKLNPKTGENMAPGYVFPLYVNTEETLDGKISNSKGLKLGVWYKAGEGECYLNTKNKKLYTKGKGYGTDNKTISRLAYRPGWHLTNTPWGSQRGANKVVSGKPGTGNNYRNMWDNEVWARVDICIEKDMTEYVKTLSNDAKYQCLQKLGDGEGYQYRTNSNATKDQTWWIVDRIKIVEILDDDTVDNINNEFYTKISKESGKRINNDPMTYTSKSGDIPYWKMPRVNNRRFSKEDLKNMGYE